MASSATPRRARTRASPRPPPKPLPPIAIHPATPDRWPDVERLFGENGACGGCWCQWWKQPQAEYRARQGAPNKRAFKASVTAGEVPGLLAYADGEPVGWVAVEPRSAYVRLASPRTLVAVDDRPVWSVTCFFAKRGWRRRGLSALLLAAAAEHARRHGAPALEGYPVDSSANQGAAFIYPGVFSTFVRAGFTEVARKARTRPVVRLELGPKRGGVRRR